ncbi:MULTISPECIES: DUF3794 domain-containing protein [unclassified Candidatus Frackibacter]|uniref:DUF3794 domain-containing protein n=1 Tax=unclassified Candidatus Frackibacter TaxID=2648818 RepID=UPI00079BFD59|nr:MULTISPECIES: DUF3794 domain-containing protein [unclassified Candidatus Frackibacter]KXS44507.1 MAG: hypothetical protein AWU54_736 [Candidatus Frackibacter sp. T328-2]SDC65835.1 protein of unknown function [Candidatus Frackibacter sp. WG11]SEM78970.1 protein of unknown function [Candidatus Frackibacter sp. WG12]SFL89742.1 protein of unknown function [Candidatus Frackibacter sp. WG13]
MPTNNIKTLRVIGEEIMQITEGTTLTLTHTPVSIVDVQLSLFDVTDHIFRDKVVKQGFIHVNVIYKGADGIVYHESTNVPFEEEVEIGGLVPGIKFNGQVRVPVQNAEETTLDVENFILELDSDFILNNGNAITPTVTVKALARILVKVSRVEQMNVFVNGRDGVFRFSGTTLDGNC